uniref:Rho GTPase activating protein 25 n=1 Tax=Erpetoichthys calabaricus TaxID=27687 RepID=A0A8C4RDA5_ERPCA
MSLKLPRNWDFNLRPDANKIARSKSMMPAESSSGPVHPGSASHLERPLKTGWLKKQRSIVKNWQMKFFVLRGSILYYYKDDKDTAIQGSIPLQGTQVNELLSNPDEAGKFQFEISPVNADRDRVYQDSHVLMANSQNEMEEWVKTIRRVMGTPSSGVVFGQRLADTILYEQKFEQHQVPILVEKCVEFIREHGLSEEGIFRLPGQDNQVKQFRDAFDAGERPSFPSETDVHTVASLFKLYLRELPEPVIPWSQYDDFLNCSQHLNVTDMTGWEHLEKQIALLPPENYSLLSYICRFLYEVQLNSSVNKMSVENLATVIGVNILRPRVEDPFSIMKGTLQIQKLMTVIISHHKELFPKSKDIPPLSPVVKNDNKKSNVPRSSVGWDVAEDPTQSVTNNVKEGQVLSESAEDLTSCGSAAWGERGNDEKGSLSFKLRKRTQTLPSRRCTFSSQGEENGCTEATGKRVGVFSNDFWNLEPSSASSEADKNTLSEDIFSALQWQNVSKCQRSSVLNKSFHSDGAEVRRHYGGTWEAQPKSPQPKMENKSTTPNLTPVPSSPSTTSRELLIPKLSDSGGNNIARKDMRRSLHAEELDTEKGECKTASYEIQVSSLQKKNQELCSKVEELEKELMQEKQRNKELEIRIRNMEAAHKEAERQNQELDKVLQSFTSQKLKGRVTMPI